MGASPVPTKKYFNRTVMDVLTLFVAGLANGSLYALVALGLVLIYKTQDVVNFAHGELLMVGAFVGFTTLRATGGSNLAAIFVAILAGGLLGAFIERIALRPALGQDHIKVAMLTVGLSFALKGIARLPFGKDILTYPPLFADHPSVHIGNSVISTHSIATIVLTIVLTVLLYFFFQATSFGKQVRATQQNAVGARLVGINPNRIFSVTWALAAAIGAVAGVLAAPVTLLYPDMGVNFLLKGFAAAVLGGFYSVPGAILGGILMGVIEMFFGGYISTAFQSISAFCVIILVLFIRPNGLLGKKLVERV